MQSAGSPWNQTQQLNQNNNPEQLPNFYPNQQSFEGNVTANANQEQVHSFLMDAISLQVINTKVNPALTQLLN